MILCLLNKLTRSFLLLNSHLQLEVGSLNNTEQDEATEALSARISFESLGAAWSCPTPQAVSLTSHQRGQEVVILTSLCLSEGQKKPLPVCSNTSL